MNKYIDAYNSMGNSGFELIDFIFKFPECTAKSWNDEYVHKKRG